MIIDLYQKDLLSIKDISEKISMSESYVRKFLIKSNIPFLSRSDRNKIKLERKGIKGNTIEEQIINLFDEGRTIDEISDLLGKSKGTIRNYFTKLKLYRKRQPPEISEQEIIKMYLEEEMTIKQIREKIRRGRKYVKEILEKNNINVRKSNDYKERFFTEEEIIKLKELIEEGYSAGKLSRYFNTTKDIIYRKLNFLKIKTNPIKEFKDIECKHCSKIFIPISPVNKFCSEECKDEARCIKINGIVDLYCELCNTKYDFKYQTPSPTRFCSKSCVTKYMELNKTDEEKRQIASKRAKSLQDNKSEKEIQNFFSQYTKIGEKLALTTEKKELRTYDVFLPEYNLVIEHDGLLWHSELGIKKFELNKDDNLNKGTIKKKIENLDIKKGK